MANKGTTPPLDVLKTWPKPNYINPENQTGQLMGVEITLCSITTIVTVLRLYSRGALTKSIGPDDWLMAGALVCAIGLTITNCLAPQWGWGVHLYDFKPEWLVPARKLAIATEFLFLPCVALTKLSILVFYHRVFSSRTFRYFIYAGVAYVIGYTISGIFIIFLQAIPLRAYWDKTIQGKFINDQIAFVIFGILNCLSDLYVFFLPIKEVWSIQLPKRQRISLVLVFALGSIVCIAGVVRIYYLWIVFSPTNWDFTYDGGPLYIATAIEGELGILCASLPALKPLIHRYVPGLLGSSGRSRATGHSPSYRLSSYDADRRRDARRIAGTGQNSMKITSITGPTMLDNDSEENILPIRGFSGVQWNIGNEANDGKPGNVRPDKIEKKVEIEVSIEKRPNESDEDLERNSSISSTPRRI